MAYPYELFRVGIGDRGTERTVDHIAARGQLGFEDPEFRARAAPIIGSGRRAPKVASRIRAFLEKRVIFQPDPLGWELLHHPGQLLEDIGRNGRTFGDCDDVAALGAALATVGGLPVRFVLLSFTDDGPWEHVYTEVETTPGRWVDLDTTRPAQYPPDYAAARRWVILPPS